MDKGGNFRKFFGNFRFNQAVQMLDGPECSELITQLQILQAILTSMKSGRSVSHLFYRANQDDHESL